MKRTDSPIRALKLASKSRRPGINRAPFSLTVKAHMGPGTSAMNLPAGQAVRMGQN